MKKLYACRDDDGHRAIVMSAVTPAKYEGDWVEADSDGMGAAFRGVDEGFAGVNAFEALFKGLGLRAGGGPIHVKLVRADR